MERITHDIKQGSSIWHLFRADHDGASEASAMLGMSPYKTREQLLHEKSTGLKAEVSAQTQKIFDKGHEVEEIARGVVEKMLGVDLYPVTMSYGKLSASCDGLSMCETIAWENKQFNKAHFEQVKNGELPEIHWPQCQQVLHVTGAEKLWFTISDGTEQNTVGVWVYPDAEKIQRIIDGWAQFKIDLDKYVPVEVIEKPKAMQIMALPSLAIQIKGEVILSNLPEFTEAATAYIESIKTEFKTDEDFANGEATIKFCEDAEKNIELTQAAAIAQTASIDELMRTLDFIKAQLRDKRLLIKKLVIAEKDRLKLEVVTKAREEFTAHVDSHLPTRLQVTMPDFAIGTKNKKTLTSMREAVNQLLVNSKIEIDALARDIKRKTDWFSDIAQSHLTLFPDFETIKYKANEDFQLLVNSRIKEHNEAQAAREANIKAIAEAEAAAKVEADRQALLKEKMQAMPQAETKLPPQLEAEFGKHFQAPKLVRSEVPPSASDLVQAIAIAYGVDDQIAHKWLLLTDFSTMMQKAA